MVLVDLGATPGAVFASVGTRPVQNPEPPPGQGAEFGKASPVAAVVILLLALATVFLIWSMSRHLRRVPASFDTDPDTSGSSPRSAEDAGDPRA